MTMVRLGDVARETKETARAGMRELPTVGLEHLQSGELALTEWDEGSENTFTKLFRKGQMLFGRRRAYLKKAAVAPFDGICSGDITVIEALPDRLLPGLLPFIIQNDDFFSFAVGKSAGSLSPRVKWEHLRQYEFTLHSLEEQARLSEIFEAAYAAREAYKKLLLATDSLIKSQFIEMFGDLGTSMSTWKTWDLVQVCDRPDDVKCGPFGTQLSKAEYKREGVAVWGIPQINSCFAKEPEDYVTIEKAKELGSYSLRHGDIAMSRKGNVGMCALFPAHFPAGIIHSDVLRIRVRLDLVNPVFLLHQLRFSPAIERQISLVSAGAIMAGINVTKLKNITVQVPPLSLQNQFAAFVEQADKSKFALQNTLEKLEATYKGLLSKHLG